MADIMNELDEVIREEIRARGPMTFVRYMELALYHPTLGYYAGGAEGREPLGWSGDYFTSGDVSPLWGWAMARRLRRMWESLRRPDPFTIVEPGGGRGLLARDVWGYALNEDQEWAEALRYVLLDRAPEGSALRAARQERIARELARLNAPDGAVRWAASWDEATSEPFVGCVVSNELFDALPVHVVEARRGELLEVYVAADPQTGALAEELGAPSSDAVAWYLDEYRIPWREYGDGWRAEVCLAAGQELREMASRLARGFLLTVDYGATARRLYTRDRRRGTLAVYARHQFLDRPLEAPGMRDLTAHVNFSALARAGAAAGLCVAGYTTQAGFLEGLGVREEIAARGARLYPAADTERQTDRGQADLLRRRSFEASASVLFDPRGLGGFRVLTQRRRA
ncbi:MAG TPA: SAM-dependent methyltransferase [Ktedonobacterales bacterium]|jgi:SAM-dependent MidA family methyltransferase|nr:SAM-dependent methyltransferase [Ktedonobacterales bacterium]